MTTQSLAPSLPAAMRMEDIQAAQATALAQAGRALWVATLSLMSAFMQNRAPAHRYLLAKRISRNFALLQEQECFAPKTRDSFARLSRRWSELAQKCCPPQVQDEGAPRGWLRRLRVASFFR